MSLAAVARANQARVRAARQTRGAARRYDDDALERARRRGAAPLPAEPGAPSLRPEIQDDGLEHLPSETEEGVTGTDPPADPEEVRRREEEIRERLLDIEAALNRIGVSGLPYAPRNPNRVGSPLDAPRLRAEQERLRDELRNLAGRGARPGPEPR